jgi:succinate-semialdehyde dehydrogenase/glutarate-semialdehyde dehydrogenase
VKDAEEAIKVANDTPFGLGANLWIGDIDAARGFARRIEAGSVFINGMVALDPRLPFGGIKQRGYGRELSEFDIREFGEYTDGVDRARTRGTSAHHADRVAG